MSNNNPQRGSWRRGGKVLELGQVRESRHTYEGTVFVCNIFLAGTIPPNETPTRNGQAKRGGGVLQHELCRNNFSRSGEIGMGHSQPSPGRVRRTNHVMRGKLWLDLDRNNTEARRLQRTRGGGTCKREGQQITAKATSRTGRYKPAGRWSIPSQQAKSKSGKLRNP